MINVRYAVVLYQLNVHFAQQAIFYIIKPAIQLVLLNSMEILLQDIAQPALNPAKIVLNQVRNV
jgi:hypothetical protein